MTPTIYTGLGEQEWLALRRRNINSSEVAALFGLSPNTTEYELWHRKAGLLAEADVVGDRVEAGQYLEPAIAAWAASRFGWEARPFKDYYEIGAERIGSSFDWEILDWPDDPLTLCGPGILEIKNVDWLQFRLKWNDDGDLMAPPHIELQVQHQLLVSGCQWAVIVVLVGGNDLRMTVRVRNEVIIGKIRDRCAAFWSSVDAGMPPDPDYTRDGDAIRALYARPDPRAAMPPETHSRAMELVAAATAAAGRKKVAEAEESAAKAEIMYLLREVEVAVFPDGSKVSWKANAKGLRVLRLTPSKAASPVQEDAA